MSIEDELAELRGHVRELQDLIVTIIPDDRVARLDELNLLRMTIAERAGHQAFELQRRYIEGGRYGFVVLPGWKRATVDAEVVAYVERLQRLGMDIVLGEAPEKP
jgi:hypothetical protein